jgi:hypothetical protein
VREKKDEATGGRRRAASRFRTGKTQILERCEKFFFLRGFRQCRRAKRRDEKQRDTEEGKRGRVE